jgi:hypothetical protein
MSFGRFGSDNLITLTDQSKREEVETVVSEEKPDANGERPRTRGFRVRARN